MQAPDIRCPLDGLVVNIKEKGGYYQKPNGNWNLTFNPVDVLEPYRDGTIKTVMHKECFENMRTTPAPKRRLVPEHGYLGCTVPESWGIPIKGREATWKSLREEE